MKRIQLTGTTGLRFAVPASVVPAGFTAARYPFATTLGHTEASSVSIVALVERIPGVGTGVRHTPDARPRTSVCRRSDL